MPELNFTPFHDLLTERLRLRQLTLDDAGEIFLLRSDEKVNEFIDRPKATCIEDAQSFINKINTSINNNEAFYWAITFREQPKLIGTIALWNISREKNKAEIGYELLPEYHGKGIMHEALSKVIEFGFEILKLETIEAWTHPGNNRSATLLEKNGFQKDTDAEKTKEEGVKEIIYSLNKTNYLKKRIKK